MKKIGFGMIVIFVFIVLLNGYSVRASFANNKTNENEMKFLINFDHVPDDTESKKECKWEKIIF